jgi:hypothetical protein
MAGTSIASGRGIFEIDDPPLCAFRNGCGRLAARRAAPAARRPVRIEQAAMTLRELG